MRQQCSHDYSTRGSDSPDPVMQSDTRPDVQSAHVIQGRQHGRFKRLRGAYKGDTKDLLADYSATDS